MTTLGGSSFSNICLSVWLFRILSIKHHGCKNKCGVCYKDPEQAIWKIGVGSYREGVEKEENLGVLIYFFSGCRSRSSSVVRRERGGKIEKSWRKYTSSDAWAVSYLVKFNLSRDARFHSITLELNPL